jgi:hypothetical protein
LVNTYFDETSNVINFDAIRAELDQAQNEDRLDDISRPIMENLLQLDKKEQICVNPIKVKFKL